MNCLFSFLFVVQLCACLAVAVNPRENAFINYSELALPAECKDAAPTCREQAARSLCLLLPYDLRTQCPLSCRVRKCNIRTERQINIPGYATPNGTTVYAKRFVTTKQASSTHFKMHYPTPDAGPEDALVLSSLGMGTYLGNTDPETDATVVNALLYSIARGWNVIDTASNYRWGAAESSIGEALLTVLAGSQFSDFPESFMNGEASSGQGVPETLPVTRDMLFISTKAGFMDDAVTKDLLHSRSIRMRDVVNGHCMHPTCLHASLNTSLARLSLQTVDLLYLHNSAEMQLPQLGNGIYMQRLAESFTFLEGVRTSGLIRTYGMATWDSFRVPPGHTAHLELEAVVKVALEVGGQGHGFKFIQLPVNAHLSEAWSERWQVVDGQPCTLLEAAQKLGVGVFTSGPLMEAQLLQQVGNKPLAVEPLRAAGSTGAKLVQWARSTPGILSTLVGQKTRAHVEENVNLAKLSVLPAEEYSSVLQLIKTAMSSTQEATK